MRKLSDLSCIFINNRLIKYLYYLLYTKNIKPKYCKINKILDL
jgi:hypothetical protein